MGTLSNLIASGNRAATTITRNDVLALAMRKGYTRKQAESEISAALSATGRSPASPLP